MRLYPRLSLAKAWADHYLARYARTYWLGQELMAFQMRRKLRHLEGSAALWAALEDDSAD